VDGAKAHDSLLRFFPDAAAAACNGDGWATVTMPDDRQVQAQCPGCWHERMADAIRDFTPARFRVRLLRLPAAVTAWAVRGAGAQGLYLAGPVGTGKTHAAWAAVAAWCAQTGTLPGGTPGVIFARMTDLLDDLRPGDDSRQRVRQCQRAALLVVDDLGAEKASEWTQERFYTIVDHRYAACLPLIVTGNLPPSRLAGQVGERAASRLAEMCEVVAMTGPDRRRPA